MLKPIQPAAPAAPKPLKQQETPKKETVNIGITDGGEFEDVPVTNIRKIIAERLSFSKQNIPHYYVTV
jgi:pyruvate dehydrogenase E2 component (dihydrolipoamide acetyltransferase)